MSSKPSVTYWPSTEPSIKRCTCVNKQKKAKQVHPVEDIGILPWPVDMVEFGEMRMPTGNRWMANNYITRCHRQLGLVSSRQWVPVAVEDSENQLQTEGLGPQCPLGWAAQPECERSAAMVRKTWDQYVAVCPRLQLTSHTQPTSTLSNKVWEVYFYKKACSFRSLKSSVCWLCFCLYLYMYCVVVCVYTTLVTVSSSL